MVKTKIFAASILALTLAGCNNDEMDNPLADGPVALGITADIGQTTTRATADGNAAHFDEGDAINVVANGSSTYVYTFQGSEWSSTAPYYFQNTASVPFRAWYAVPGVKVENNAIAIDTRTQTFTDKWNNHDILATPEVSVSVGNPGNATISFTGDKAFNHIMTQVAFTFKAGDDISDLTALSGYKLKGLITDATFNTKSCEMTAGSATGDIAMTVSGASGTEYTCAPIILVPQTIASNKIELEVTYNGQSYKANLTAPAGSLQTGYSYTYTITIKNTKLEIGNAEISSWKQSPSQELNHDATLQ